MVTARNKAKKIIQVPIEKELLERIDTSSSAVDQSRVAFIREACKQRLKSLEVEKLDRRYVVGYQRKPEGLEWTKASAGLLAKRLPEEMW